ncbi:SabA family sialic acid-binding adhesin [Helicobacter pylori]|uniref:outer membrane protein n=1 Tax=Helicobacter pylori TaxID=210 RepID=UPI0003AC8C75|nr:SabA family sialic acid-binding adhesin [Helicobacter pylori]EPZ94577.1 membrane protein [Helicobacter pylori UM077]
MKKMKKTILLSLTLAASLLHAEDNGVFLSVGYQIGEAVQKVKNADKVQKLSDAYENLNKLLANHARSHQEINANSATAINQAIGNLNANTQNLIDKTDNSPAYQATLLALQSTVGLWNSIAYAVICGGYTDKPNSTTETFYNQPGQNSDSITCGGNTSLLQAGKNSHLSIEQFATLNKAYQIIQAALKKGLPALSNTTTTVEVTIKTATNAKNINVNNGNNNAADTTISITNTYINDAQNLLTQAQTIINTLQDNCPMLKGKPSSGTSGANTPSANTPSWQTSANQNSCSVFGTEFSAISNMINNAQSIVKETQQLNTTPLKSIAQPHNFNLNSPNSIALAQSMLKNAQSQETVLKLANQVGSDFNRISTGVLKNYIEECGANNSNESVSNNTWGKGCAGVKETLASLEKSNASFDSQTPQINEAQTLASTLIQELGNNPFGNVGMIVSSATNNGALNGFGVQAGYKQFFGKKKRWGLRYYGFFDYNHAYIKSNFFNSASDVWTYGVGSDLLFNFINDKNTNFLGKNNKISVGVFGGIALAGTSWLNSQFVNLKTISNVYSAKVNTANFQFLFNLGLRTNLARPKKKDSHHVAQHGMELGVKIPTINTNYYSFLDTKLEYRRLYSVYLNYVFAY